MEVRKTVVVLGMHRSGTSVVAGVLHALGVNMGTQGESWVGKHWSNPTGHFENPKFVALDQRILGGDATGLRGIPRWEAVASRTTEFEREIRALLSDSERELWGWKDPWTVLTLELFLPFLKHPSFVIVRRPKEEVLSSLEKRASSRDETLAQLWELYERRLADLTVSLPPHPVLTVQYHDLLDDPRSSVGRLIDFLGIRPGREELDRALGLILKGPALRREVQRMAIRGAVGFPAWVGWILKRDLQLNPGVVPSDLLSSVPRELLQVLRALL